MFPTNPRSLLSLRQAIIKESSSTSTLYSSSCSLLRQQNNNNTNNNSTVSKPLITHRTLAKLTSYSVASTYETKTPVLQHSPEAAHARKLLPTRTGLLARKVGMITWFNGLADNNNNNISSSSQQDIGDRIIGGSATQMFPCTVLEIDRCQVTHTKTMKNGDRYCAVQIGMSDAGISSINLENNNIDNINPQTLKGYEDWIRRKFTRQQLGHFARAGVAPKKHVAEFLVKDDKAATALPLGTLIGADHFQIGQYIDVKGHCKGKGFAGVMKRHGFHGMGASHGNSLSHRSAGSTGMNQDPGRVLPGKKMPGHMGTQNVTVQNALVIDVNPEFGYILVKGSVPGPKGSIVKITDAKKKLPEYLN